VRPVKLIPLFLIAVPVQLAFLGTHLVLALWYPQQKFWLDALPLLYLGATYLQWLFWAFVISFRNDNCRVPIIMHVPHLLSFLPLIRHVMLAAEHHPSSTASLTIAWIHCVATHSFSLVAAWLWQLRGRFSEDEGFPAFRRNLMPFALYTLAALTMIALYAGADFRFARTDTPLAVGLIQLVLSMAVTLVLIYREPGSLRPLAIFAALVFSLTNGLLLFDSATGDFGPELALAASSFTQIFTLYVILLFNRSRA
jgi:hypothetical protein